MIFWMGGSEDAPFEGQRSQFIFIIATYYVGKINRSMLLRKRKKCENRVRFAYVDS